MQRDSEPGRRREDNEHRLDHPEPQIDSEGWPPATRNYLDGSQTTEHRPQPHERTHKNEQEHSTLQLAGRMRPGARSVAFPVGRVTAQKRQQEGDRKRYRHVEDGAYHLSLLNAPTSSVFSRANNLTT